MSGKTMSLQEIYNSLENSPKLSSGIYFLRFGDAAAETVNYNNDDQVTPNVLYNIDSDFSYGFDISRRGEKCIELRFFDGGWDCSADDIRVDVINVEELLADNRKKVDSLQPNRKDGMKAEDLQEALGLHNKYLGLSGDYDLIESSEDCFDITIRGLYQSDAFKTRVKAAVLFAIKEEMIHLQTVLNKMGVEV